MNDFNPAQAGLNIGKAVIFILLLSFVGIVVYKNYFANRLSGGKDYTRVPTEMQINYIPSDYRMAVNEEEALAILQNPQKNRKAFNQLVYDLNISILEHVANRMNLGQKVRSQIKTEYEKHHPYLRNLYYQDFITLKDTTSVLYQSWYNNESTNAVEALHEVASKYTCFLVNHIITTLVQTDNGSLWGKGQKVDTPCGIALNEAVNPLIKRMEERAAIQDFGRSRGILQEKVERAIAELATMEVSDKKGINKQMQTKVWGFSVSSTDIEISAISILKVGFRLNDYFNVDLNSKTGIVTITLPPPTILSHEVYPQVDKLDIGWLREVKEVDLNSNINMLREAFRDEALRSGIMEESKTQAIELMNTMFGPLISSINNRYQLRVAFREGNAEDQEISQVAQ
jgi:hypothetical protein